MTEPSNMTEPYLHTSHVLLSHSILIFAPHVLMPHIFMCQRFMSQRLTFRVWASHVFPFDVILLHVTPHVLTSHAFPFTDTLNWPTAGCKFAEFLEDVNWIDLSGKHYYLLNKKQVNIQSSIHDPSIQINHHQAWPAEAKR